MKEIFDTTITFKNGVQEVIRGLKPVQGKRVLHIAPAGKGATVVVPFAWAKEARFNRVEATDAA